MQLRRQLQTSRTNRKADKKASDYWRKKYEKSLVTRAELRKKNKKLSRRIKYYETLLSNVKNNISSLKKSAEKQLIYKILKDNKPVRSNGISLYNDHYGAKMKKKTFDISALQAKKLRVRARVREFYLSDENSAPSPSASAFVTKGNRKMRKRFLLDTVEELYKKYCKTEGEKIRRANSARLFLKNKIK